MSAIKGQKWGQRKDYRPGQRAWELAHPGAVKANARRFHLKKFFGLSEADYDKMLEAQGGVCAVCGQPETSTMLGQTRRLAVDHNHETNEVRALLCADCNRAIGMMQDSPELLEQAALYLTMQRRN